MTTYNSDIYKERFGDNWKEYAIKASGFADQIPCECGYKMVKTHYHGKIIDYRCTNLKDPCKPLKFDPDDEKFIAYVDNRDTTFKCKYCGWNSSPEGRPDLLICKDCINEAKKIINEVEGK